MKCVLFRVEINRGHQNILGREGGDCIVDAVSHLLEVMHAAGDSITNLQLTQRAVASHESAFSLTKVLVSQMISLHKLDVSCMTDVAHVDALLLAMKGRAESLVLRILHVELVALHGKGVRELELTSTIGALDRPPTGWHADNLAKTVGPTLQSFLLRRHEGGTDIPKSVMEAFCRFCTNMHWIEACPACPIEQMSMPSS